MAASNYDYADNLGPGTAYDEPSPGLSGLIKLLILVFGLLAIAAFGWVIWIAYDEGVRAGAVKTVPVIRADASEIRRKPEEPGGLVVPHQDKLVFSRLAPGQADEPIERLLPLPEAPLTLPAKETIKSEAVKSVGAASATAETEIATALTPSLVQPAPPQKLAPPSPPAPPPDPAEIVAKTPPASAAPLNLPAVEPEKSPAAAAPKAPPQAPDLAAKTPPPPPVVEKAPPVVPATAWRIQLVSLSSQKDAEAVWVKMQKANTDLLGKLQLRVQTVKLSKGTFYRVQAGPLSDRTAAASLCSSLKSRKQDCLVVAPK